VDPRFTAYLLVSAVLIVTPGPDTFLVARNAVKRGYPAARSTAFGVGTGILLWGVFTAVGLAATFSASPVVFSGVKLAGATFLVVLGMRSLWAAIRTREVTGQGSQLGPIDSLGAFVQGLVGNLLNPKAAAIFVTVVPQFMEHADPPSRLAAMIGAFVVMVVIWLNAYGFLVAKAAKQFGPRTWHVLEGLAGALLVGIGVLLAVEHR
jgi:threonine/homoserine/homoserine lactone efflux protein